MATDPLDAIYDEAAQEWNVHPALLRAVAGQESGGTRDPDRAVSPAGARGRMQLMPNTAIGLGVTDTADPRQNIFAGAKYLSQQLDKYGRVEPALAAYNAGPGRVDDYLAGRGPLPNETRNYVPAVSRRYQALVGNQPQRPQPVTDAVSGALGVDAGGIPSGDDAPPAPAPVSAAPAGNAAPRPAAPPSADAGSAYRQAIGAADAPAADATPSAYQMAIGTPPAPPPSASTPSLVRDIGSTLQDAGQALGIVAPASPPPLQVARLGDPNKPRPSEDRFGPIGWDAAAQNLDAARQADAAKTADQRVQEALAPAPNTTYSEVLPLAKDDTTGAVRLALPSSLRSLLTGGYELSQGPATGTVTPLASQALAGAMMGGSLNPSLARGTGEGIGARLFGQGRNEADDYLGEAFRTNPKYIAPPASDANPLSGIPAAPLGTPGPTSMALPGVTPPANPLSFPSLPQNPLAGAPAPSTAPAAAAGALGSGTPPTVNLLAGAVPEKGPGNPFLPIVSQKGAASRVDTLLSHFGQGGNTDPVGSALMGSPPTLAQATGNAGYAALENGLRSVDPQFNNLWTARAAARTQARNQAYQGIAGATGDVEAAEAARDAATSAAREAAFANTSPVDAQPFVDTINGILASPDGKRDAVTRSLQPLLNKVQAAGGNGLETDPAQLYGVRKAINDQLSSVGTQEGADAKAATRQLLQARAALDGVIEQGAPGFGDYIAQHAEMSRPIDGQRWLQAQNVTDAQGNIVLTKLDSAVKRLDAQRGKPGASLADGVTDDQIATMRAIRDDMRQEAAANATKPVGSNTIQNAATSTALEAGKWGANIAAALGGGLTANPVTWGAGSVPGAALRYGLGKLGARGEQLVRDELRNRLLNPQVPGRNPLAGTPPNANPLAAVPTYYSTRP